MWEGLWEKIKARQITQVLVAVELFVTTLGLREDGRVCVTSIWCWLQLCWSSSLRKSKKEHEDTNTFLLYSSLCLSPALGSLHYLTCFWCILLAKVNEKLESKGVQGVQTLEVASQGTEQDTEGWLLAINPEVLLLRYNRSLFLSSSSDLEWIFLLGRWLYSTQWLWDSWSPQLTTPTSPGVSQYLCPTIRRKKEYRGKPLFLMGDACLVHTFLGRRFGYISTPNYKIY